MTSNTVCRFFANGNCRFGSGCWYRHESPPDNRNRSYKNLTYHAQSENQPQNRRTNLSHSDIQEIVEVISEEAKESEYGNMWPLTCLSVMPAIPLVLGWEDFSMEELRHTAYLAKANGRFSDYIEYFENLKMKTKEQRLIFLKPGKMAQDLVRKMVDNRKPRETSFAASGGSFGSNNSFGSSSTTYGNTGFASGDQQYMFKNAAKDPAPGLFAMAAQGFKSSPFGESFSQSNNSINDTAMETALDFSVSFAQPAASSTFQQNIFGSAASPTPFSAPSPTASSPFGATSPTASNPFGSISPTASHPFGITSPTASNPFGTSSTTASDPFGPAAPILPTSSSQPIVFPGFGSVPAISTDRATVNNNDPAFTPMADLTAEELEQFKATTFTLQKLPLRPPPQELC